MTTPVSTPDALLCEAKRLFWARGFSNVSVREIAKGAGVDVALINRYFGSKKGLFDATLNDIGALDAADFAYPDAFVDWLVHLFQTAPRPAVDPSPVTMILVNAGDAVVGDGVRALYCSRWHEPITQILGDPGKAAMLSAALLGMSIAEKTMHLPGIAPPNDPTYAAQFRSLLRAAVDSPNTSTE